MCILSTPKLAEKSTGLPQSDKDKIHCVSPYSQCPFFNIKITCTQPPTLQAYTQTVEKDSSTQLFIHKGSTHPV